MDVPYDPACPLLIDSDDESIVSGDESFDKKYDDLLSKKMDSKYNAAVNSFEQKSRNDARFVPAFEDDNEELLNYCLRESGFLTDDDVEVKEVAPSDTRDDFEKKDDKEDQPKEENGLELDRGVNEQEAKREIETDVKNHRKKKKKQKEKVKESKDRRDRGASSDLTKESKSKKDATKKDKGDKSHKHALKEKKSSHNSSDKHQSRKNDLPDIDDDDEIFATLADDGESFPLSKIEDEFEARTGIKESDKKHVRDKHKKDRSLNRAQKRKTDSAEKYDKEVGKKRHRSKSSSHKRSKSSDSDEPERKKKKKKKQKENPSEKEQHRHDKKRSDSSTHKKKRKDHDRNLEESSQRQKKRKQSHDKDVEKKSSHHDRDYKTNKYSEASSGKSHVSHRTLPVEKDRAQKNKHVDSESNLKRKEKYTKDSIRNHHHKDKSRKHSESEERRRKHNEGREKDKKRISHKDTNEDAKSSSKPIQNIGKEKSLAKVLSKEEVIHKSTAASPIDQVKKVIKENDTLLSDTDSEFGRLSDIEREIEQENNNAPFSPQSNSNIIKQNEDTDLEGENKMYHGISMKNETDSICSPDDKQVNVKDLNEHSDSNQKTAEERESTTEQGLQDLSSDNDQPSSPISSEGYAEKEEIVENKAIVENKESDESKASVENKGIIENEKNIENKADFENKTGVEDKTYVRDNNIVEDKGSASFDAKVHDKRPFKLFSQAETIKLHKELLSKDDKDGDIVEAQSVESENESSDEVKCDIKEQETMVKEEENIASEGNDLQSDIEVPKNDEIDINVLKHAQKSKDDLFDDIFAKEDSEMKNDYEMAKMYERVDDTSPKRMPFKRQKSGVGKDENVYTTDKKELKQEASSIVKSALVLEDNSSTRKQDKSPDKKNTHGAIIPGLEPVSIPGLEPTEVKEDDSTSFKTQTAVPSRIPLLFDDGSDNEKSDRLQMKAEPYLSPKRDTKRKQPYTPPEEFIGETENNQFDRYYHVEVSDSPYNPEDLTPLDMGLTPSDASIIQREALKGTVELKLKDPFSGFDNPTWQKILEAKSKHETKRQRDKGTAPGDKVDKRVVKHHTKSANQDKLMNVLVRQSRVEQECKEVLKLYYKSKEITKEEYKNILRKAVPQVTMSNSPIIPEKIRSLMKKFVCKCKGQRLMSGHEKPIRKKRKVPKTESLSHELTFPGEKQFRYLNPNLPMPPL